MFTEKSFVQLKGSILPQFFYFIGKWSLKFVAMFGYKKFKKKFYQSPRFNGISFYSLFLGGMCGDFWKVSKIRYFEEIEIFPNSQPTKSHNFFFSF
jgi:hypothetical protein